MWPNPQFSADLVTFAEEIPNGKLHFLYRRLRIKAYGYLVDDRSEDKKAKKCVVKKNLNL